MLVFYMLQVFFEAIQRLSSGEVCRDTLMEICSCKMFTEKLKIFLKEMRNYAIVPFLVTNDDVDFEALFDQAEKEDTPGNLSHLLYSILLAEVKPSFYKINIHAAMTPSDIKNQLDPIFKRADIMLKMHKTRLLRTAENTEEAPMVTVRILDDGCRSSAIFHTIVGGFFVCLSLS